MTSSSGQIIARALFLGATLFGLAAMAGAASADATDRKMPPAPRLTEQPGASAMDVTIADAMVFPESLSADAAGTLYVGSVKGIIYRALAGSDMATAWIKPNATNGLQRVLGIVADDRSRTLWACTSPAVLPGPSTPGAAAVVAFDLTTGALKARYPLPGPPGACNDIAIASDGTAFVTEGSNGRLFAIAPGTKQATLFAQDPALVGVHGIAFAGDGKLYVNNAHQNMILRVDRKPDGSFASLTRLIVSMPLNGPSGLRPLQGSQFLQAEEQGGRVSLLTISGDRVDVKVIEDNIPGTAAVDHVGDVAYTAEGKINYLFDPKLKGKDPGPFVMRAVPMEEAQ